ncbi:hypothetical protein [Cellulomonas fengjieae]|uniref:Uncharacterized protein n=1 Tax=Cellulomonas fengjieae TaxID=2819978 RepID=A0ABS3SCK7_9CELL|nr:hypothetical protein [Cellulomonas fengjieae]MBO3083059.1 hypothetical protein [Cellulomonas fengjieae]QVI65571.1 hypothetical protein KG102_15965 [Cellulomonas fengjieae]
MSHRTSTIARGVEYHRVLERRGVGRGILAIVLLVAGMTFFGIVLVPGAVVVATAVVVWVRSRRTGPARTPATGGSVAYVKPTEASVAA